MAIETTKRNLTDITISETKTVAHAMTELTCEFIKNIFRVAKAANVKEHDLVQMAAFSMNISKDDPVFWECVALGIVEEIEEEDKEG